MAAITPVICSGRPADIRLKELIGCAHEGRRTLIMGILNVTPDSFSDGGEYADVESACRRACRMIDEGAEIIDIGGESTRPATFRTAEPLSEAEELARVLPVIRKVAGQFPETPISIDTYKSCVAREAVAAGAGMINDISAMRADAEMAGVMARSGAAVCLMHLAGLPKCVDPNPAYADVVRDVGEHLLERAAVAIEAGVPRERIFVDPGIGFGKSAQQNLELLRRLNELIPRREYPVLVGVSRKSTIGAVLGGGPDDRLEGTAAAVALSIGRGAAMVRVHDVKQMAKVARMADAIVRGWAP